MKKCSRLAEYLKISRECKDQWGWISTYEAPFLSDGWAALAGHYSGMLDDLITIIGHDKVEALVVAHDAIFITEASEEEK